MSLGHERRLRQCMANQTLQCRCPGARSAAGNKSVSLARSSSSVSFALSSSNVMHPDARLPNEASEKSSAICFTMPWLTFGCLQPIAASRLPTSRMRSTICRTKCGAITSASRFSGRPFLMPYVRKWNGGRDYLTMLDEVKRLS
jgi:hypothetical protein